MKWTITLSRAVLISVIIVTILVPLCFSQPQYKCKNPDESCVKYNLCPNFTAIVRSKAFESCYTQNHIVSICCKNSALAATPPTHTATPSTSAVSPSTASPPPVRRRNSTAVALEYCQKYTEYIYQLRRLPPQLPGELGTDVKVLNCAAIDPLVMNGPRAWPKGFPHMALIGFGKTIHDVQWACSGSLISEKFILSAAHCGKTSVRGPPRWVKLGDLDVNTTNDEARPAIYSIVKVYDHPEYNSRLGLNDISLFELYTTVAMSPYVRPACLSTVTSHPNGTVGKRTGWGLTRQVKEDSGHLLATAISTVEEWRCENKFQTNGYYNSTSMICAGDLITHECLGDSGGPLQTETMVTCMWEIIGVTTQGAEICGSKENPSVFTRVSFYLDWIQSIVWP